MTMTAARTPTPTPINIFRWLPSSVAAAALGSMAADCTFEMPNAAVSVTLVVKRSIFAEVAEAVVPENVISIVAVCGDDDGEGPPAAVVVVVPKMTLIDVPFATSMAVDAGEEVDEPAADDVGAAVTKVTLMSLALMPNFFASASLNAVSLNVAELTSAVNFRGGTSVVVGTDVVVVPSPVVVVMEPLLTVVADDDDVAVTVVLFVAVREVVLVRGGVVEPLLIPGFEVDPVGVVVTVGGRVDDVCADDDEVVALDVVVVMAAVVVEFVAVRVPVFVPVGVPVDVIVEVRGLVEVEVNVGVAVGAFVVTDATDEVVAPAVVVVALQKVALILLFAV